MWLKERRKDSKKKHKACKSFNCYYQKLFKREIYRSPLKLHSFFQLRMRYEELFIDPKSVDCCLYQGVPSPLTAPPSGFPLYLFPLRFKRMPLQSLTQMGCQLWAASFEPGHWACRSVFLSRKNADCYFAILCEKFSTTKVPKERHSPGRRWSA